MVNLARVRRLLPLALLLASAVSAACTALAWLLAVTAYIPLSDAYRVGSQLNAAGRYSLPPWR